MTTENTTSDSIQSQCFTKSKSDFNWALVLFPRGVNEETKDHVSLFIKLCTKDATKNYVGARYELFIANKED